MFTPLTLTVALFLFGLALWGVVLAVAGKPPDRPYLLAVVAGEVEVVAHALIAGVAILAGHRPGAPAEFGGYILVSVMLLPFVLQLSRAGSTRWDSATIGAVCLAVGVAVIRLLALW